MLQMRLLLRSKKFSVCYAVSVNRHARYKSFVLCRNAFNVIGDRFKLRTEAYYTVKIAEFIFAVRETFNFKSAEASVPDKSVTCHNGRYFYTQSFKFVKYFIGTVSGTVANYRQVGVFLIFSHTEGDFSILSSIITTLFISAKVQY